LKNVFEDELGIEVLHDFLLFRTCHTAIQNFKENIGWFDNIIRSLKKGLNKRKSLADAIAF
jgi:hypothetical protein